MIKFFRKIRYDLMEKNKTGRPALPAGRYFKYAIGEIVLVVIGILIALQVNNWNQERLQTIKAEDTLKIIFRDLEMEFLMLSAAGTELSAQMNSLTEVSNGKINEDNLESFLDNLTGVFIYSLTNKGYLFLNQPGNMDLIADEELKEALYLYYEDMVPMLVKWSVWHENITTNIEEYAMRNLPIEIGYTMDTYKFCPLLDGQLKSIINFQVTNLKSIVDFINFSKHDIRDLQNKLKAHNDKIL